MRGGTAQMHGLRVNARTGIPSFHPSPSIRLPVEGRKRLRPVLIRTAELPWRLADASFSTAGGTKRKAQIVIAPNIFPPPRPVSPRPHSRLSA